MKFGIISMFAIYLVIRLLLTLVLTFLAIGQKVSAKNILIISHIENYISLFFAIMIILLDVKSGGKA